MELFVLPYRVNVLLKEERVSCLQSRMMCQRLNLSPLIALCGITHMHIVLPDV